MWRKYAEKYYELMKSGFFVGLDDLGLKPEEIETLKNQVDNPKKIGLQLMENIALEILAEIRKNEKMILRYASEKYDEFFCGEFNKLSFGEKHFLIAWALNGYSLGVPGRLGSIERTAFQAYNMIITKQLD